jgi:1,4-dihydroxy-2-naphthoate octaprenyltransferase
MLLGNYPMTQVYQHEEDQKRGDITMSLLLGIKGTFSFVAIIFTFTSAAFFMYFNHFYSIKYGIWFLISLSPVLLFFLYWFAKVLKDASKTNYQSAMILNFVSSTCLNAFFIFVFLDSTRILDALK